MEKEPYRFYIKTDIIIGLNAAVIHDELNSLWTKSYILLNCSKMGKVLAAER